MKKAGKKSTLIASGVMLVVCALLCLIPDAHTNPSSLIPREQVRIESVDNTQLAPLGIVYSGSQTCEVTVLSGEYAGETALASNYQNSALDKDKLFAPGDTAYAMVQMGANGLMVTLIDHSRTGTELWIFAALALALIAVGGAVGCGALVSLVSSVVIVWKLLIPLLLDGVNPILASFLTVLALIALGQWLIVELGGEVFRTVPLSWQEWAWIVGLTSLIALGGEAIRALRRRQTCSCRDAR